jgi:outer membrane immunogenic protein
MRTSTATKALAAAIGLVALGMTSAHSADLPARTYTKAPVIVAPAYDWSGFYIGLNGGGGSSRECWTITADNGAPIVPNTSEGCHNATGGLVGGQIGYRWQAANFVFGVEAQGDWADLNGTNSSSFFTFIPTSNRTRIDGIGLFTGQVGYAWNNVLLYVKGGAAVTANKYSSFITANGFQVDQASEARWGGAVGTGLEIGFAPNWSVAVEYNHLFMGNPNIAFPATPGVFAARSDNIGQSVDMGTVRVNYRWGGPVVAKY